MRFSNRELDWRSHKVRKYLPGGQRAVGLGRKEWWLLEGPSTEEATCLLCQRFTICHKPRSGSSSPCLFPLLSLGSGRFREKASILHKIAKKKCQVDENERQNGAANHVGESLETSISCLSWSTQSGQRQDPMWASQLSADSRALHSALPWVSGRVPLPWGGYRAPTDTICRLC